MSLLPFFRKHLNTPRLLVGSFMVAILVGASLLRLPLCVSEGHTPLGAIDALFTATSAVCVTGLTVRDTGVELSFFGQLLVLLLIQAGGLGILTLSNFALLIGTGRMRSRSRGMLEDTFGALPYIHPREVVHAIFIYTFTIEAIGAALLAWRFSMDYTLDKAIWLGIFHAVSAFCNAGFSLFPNSFVGYQDDPFTNTVLMVLIVLGGLGFLVVADVKNRIWYKDKYESKHLSLHTRVVLWTTFVLIVAGACIFTFLEWASVPAGRHDATHFLRMCFLSVTARTAGFNTVEIGGLTNATLLVLMILMFIGAAPGSTGGGIKVTALATMYAVVRSRLRARPDVEILNRQIPLEIVGKAIAAIAGFSTTVVVAVILLEWTELANFPHSEVKGAFLAHLFEVISATGTVGLSMGITGSLSDGGKAVITACMFLGRLGPVIVGASLVGSRQSAPYKLPREPIMIG